MPINICNLSYAYDKKTVFEKGALFDINLDINEGDFLGIIGHTGSGKSTLVSHLNALIKVQSGTILVDGVDLSQKFDFKALRSKVGMVFQYPEHQLFDETVLKDVSFGPKNMKLDADEVLRRAENAIRLVGLNFDEIKDRSPFELSGGQMRKVALAGVLAMQPEVLILDEPTAGLDPRGKLEIMALIQSLRSHCKSIIMISHNMDEVSANCNRIVVMSGGKVYGDYKPSELFMQTSLLKELNIDVPAVSQLISALNDKGFKIEDGIITESELIDAIERQYRERRDKNA